MPKHKVSIVVSVRLEVEAESYREAIELVSERLRVPGAFQVLGADTDSLISVEGVGPPPTLNLDKPPVSPSGVHALEVHSLSVDSPTRFK